jgi:PHP family Zn ribbon phosphoesterase
MAVTIEQIRKHDNGAQFYAADLHVHSYGASADVSDSGMTVEAIIDAAHKNGISILGITDHNTAANVERALEYGAIDSCVSNVLCSGWEDTDAPIRKPRGA